jgi:regulator of protease activity HflC (stomatin/prohibitin superfamily)
MEKGRGCAVGCSLNSIAVLTKSLKIDRSAHALYEQYIGVPKILARLEDRIFEGSSVAWSLDWPVRFGATIPESADLSMVWPRFALWLLDVELRRLAKGQESIASLDEVSGLYREWIGGTKPHTDRWVSARRNAHAYAAAAADAEYAAAYAYAYAYAAAAYAAEYAAAYAYADPYAYAAAAAADAYAEYAAAAAAAAYADAEYAAGEARSKSYERQGEKLLELMAAA